MGTAEPYCYLLTAPNAPLGSVAEAGRAARRSTRRGEAARFAPSKAVPGAFADCDATFPANRC